MYSLTDRLSDTPLPEDTGRTASAADMRDMVSRDLEDLLNTRSEPARTLASSAFTECAASSLTFGIPDFSSYSVLGTKDRDRIRRSLEVAISTHETRLSRIRVTLEPQRQFERALRFKVDALLNLGPEHEKVQFDAVLQLATQICAVT